MAKSMKKSLEIVLSSDEREKVLQCKEELIKHFNTKSLSKIIKVIFFAFLDEHFEFEDEESGDEGDSDGDVEEW